MLRNNSLFFGKKLRKKAEKAVKEKKRKAIFGKKKNTVLVPTGYGGASTHFAVI